MQPSDWPAVKAIYEQGIATKLATFETSAPDWSEWDAAYLDEHRLVAEEDGEVSGGPRCCRPPAGRATPASPRTASTSPSTRAAGVSAGRCSTELLEDADRAGIWTIQASIFADNVASIEFHKRCGFRVIGTRERIAQLDGVWRDTVLLERRGP